MADETTGTGAGQTTPSDADAQAQTAETAAAQTQAGEMIPKSEADKQNAAARRDADAKAKEAQKALDAANARLKELEDEKTAAERAKLDEQDRLKLEADEARQAKDAAEARATRAEADALRARLIMEQAPSLPARYKRTIEGATEEDIAASIEAAKADYAADTAGRLTPAEWRAILTEAAPLTPEARAEKWPAFAADLAEHFKQAPQSVGSPSNQPGQPGAGTQSTYAELRAQADKLPPGAQRESALVAALASKQ